MHEERRQRYEDYITGASPMAAATGRREPYHLTFIRRHGAVPEPGEVMAQDIEKSQEMAQEA